MNVLGKRLLVLGGTFQHCKIVESAHKLGVTVYVLDYLPLEKAPAKQIADYHYEYNITDYDLIVDLCKTEHIDGVIASHLDACQIPYQVICERIGYPCFGTKKQFEILTNKKQFIQFCKECEVDTIPQYTEEDFLNFDGTIDYPIFVKPCDSRGSRGQTVCYSFEEVNDAILFAKSESKSKNVIIEKYMGGKQDFTVSYMVINAEPYLIRTGDRYLGDKNWHMDKSAVFGIAPSVNTDFYTTLVEHKIVNMIKKLGIKNGPVFFQGFIDGDKVRVYDPGLRFPGIEYDTLYDKTNDTSIEEALIEFSLTGRISDKYIPVNKSYYLNGMYAANLFIVLKPGTIKSINGLDEVVAHSCVVTTSIRYNVGDTIGEHWNVNQRFGEFDLLCNSKEEMKDLLKWMYDTLQILNENDQDMKISLFNVDLLNA